MMLGLWYPKRRVESSDAEYADCGHRMSQLVRTIPGFLSINGYTSADGEVLVMARFKTPESLEMWRSHPEHRVAQERARQGWYDAYRGEVYELRNAYAFDRDRGRRVLTPESLATLHAGNRQDFA